VGLSGGEHEPGASHHGSALLPGLVAPAHTCAGGGGGAWDSKRASQAALVHEKPREREGRKPNCQVTKADFLWESAEPTYPAYHITVGIQPHPHPLPATGSLISTSPD